MALRVVLVERNGVTKRTLPRGRLLPCPTTTEDHPLDLKGLTVFLRTAIFAKCNYGNFFDEKGEINSRCPQSKVCDKGEAS
jgi:hypothetical protein